VNCWKNYSCSFCILHSALQLVIISVDISEIVCIDCNERERINNTNTLSFYSILFYSKANKYFLSLIHNPGAHCFLCPSPKFILANLMFQTEHTFPNCFPSLGSLPYPLDRLLRFIVAVFILHILSNYT